MGKAIRATLFTILLIMAIGLEYSAVAQRCSSTYDCRLTQCPCINGFCQPDCHSTPDSSVDRTSLPAKESVKVQLP
ncbi:hypothetical protein vseg_002074 [Gypsophila vaccaria]